MKLRFSVVAAVLAAVALGLPSGAVARTHRTLAQRLQATVDGQVKGGVPGIVIHVIDPARHLN